MNDFDENENIQEFLDEYNVGERVAFSNNLLDIHGRQPTLIEKSLLVMLMFINNINTYDYDYISKVTPQQQEYIINSAKKTPNIIHKNATCFVLGYLVLSGNDINKNKLDVITKKILPIISDDIFSKNINTQDVIRYARLWINVISKL